MMKKPLLVILSVLVAAASFSLFNFRNKSKFGTVIVLNGPSVAGKTSIQKDFQKLMLPNLWVKIGIDNFLVGVIPEINIDKMEFWQTPNSILYTQESIDTNGKKIITLHLGVQGEKVMFAMNSAIAEYAKAGCNVIVDYIAYKQEYLKDLEEKLKDINSYFIAVKIPLQTLEIREAVRKTSPVGHSRSHYFSVYGEKKYDLEVNSESNSAIEIAQQIKNFIENKK